MQGRPSKNGVDYFPHLVKHGETMFLLEKAFGNDGYAAWFKILETLACQPGHYIFCDGNSHHWDYLKAKTSLDDEKLTAIIDLLARLGAIDISLWSEKRVIWSENFLSRIAYVYAKRKAEIPAKPTFCDRKGSKSLFPSQAVTESGQEKRTEEKRREEKNILSLSLGTFQNVKISEDEYAKLKGQFGKEDADKRIETLSEYIASVPDKAKKYKSHYATILSWARRDSDGNKKARSAVDEGLAKFLATEDNG